MPLPNPSTRMTADEFVGWAMRQLEGEHYELVAGEISAMAPQRATHIRAKFHIASRLAAAIEAAGANCEMFIDGLSVVVDSTTVYEPDALIRCADPMRFETGWRNRLHRRSGDRGRGHLAVQPWPRHSSETHRLLPATVRPALSDRQRARPDHRSPRQRGGRVDPDPYFARRSDPSGPAGRCPDRALRFRRLTVAGGKRVRGRRTTQTGLAAAASFRI